jgi:hypothetical protein
MKTQDQIKAIAELDGWENDGMGGSIWHHDDHMRLKLFEELNYLTSRDAICAVIEKQPFAVKEKIETYLKCHGKVVWLFLKPADELVEALLRARGKWVEL